MTSIIWLDEGYGSALYNIDISNYTYAFNISSCGFNDRHIIGKGNILEGRVGK